MNTTDNQTDQDMAARVAFFVQHAGFSYDPATETREEGRLQCAMELERAERWARDHINYDWQGDWSVDHEREYDCYDPELEPDDIPADFPVRPLVWGTYDYDDAGDRVTCGHCGLSWDDSIPTTYTPAPSAHCPFESFHIYPPTTCELCIARDADTGEVLASLGCIDDATDDYRRVIEAELATEAMHAWEIEHREAGRYEPTH